MKRQPRLSPRSTKALRTVSIIGTGSYVPDKILTNADLSRMVDTSDDWIITRTGIKERRIAAKDENTSDMAAKAALKAIEQAKISPKDRKSTRLNSSHRCISYAVFCLKKKKQANAY